MPFRICTVAIGLLVCGLTCSWGQQQEQATVSSSSNNERLKPTSGQPPAADVSRVAYEDQLRRLSNDRDTASSSEGSSEQATSSSSSDSYHDHLKTSLNGD